MSGLAGGGGSFPSATAGADQVFALLALLGDDRKFKQRLTELKQAEDAAQAVIAEAATLKGEVERAKREVDAARLLVTEEAADLAKRGTAFEAQRGALERVMLERETDVNNKIAGYTLERESFDKWRQRTKEDFDNLKAALDKRERQVATVEQAMATLETKVRAKLIKIQEISQAGE